MTFNSKLQIYVSYGVSSQSHLVQHLIIQIHIITNNMYIFIHTILWECVQTLQIQALSSITYSGMLATKQCNLVNTTVINMHTCHIGNLSKGHQYTNSSISNTTQNTIKHKSINFIIAIKQNKQQLTNLSKCIKLNFKTYKTKLDV